MKHRILLADKIHIHAKNFSSLFDYLSRTKASVVAHDRHSDLKQAYGRYEEDERLMEYVQVLRTLDDGALRLAEHGFHEQPLRLFPLCQAECLAFALAQRPQIHRALERYASPDEWDTAIQTWLIENDRELVIRNMASAQFWIDEWAGFFGERGSIFSEAFVFGGSPTYMRTLMEICRWSKTRVFALESTLTGHEFYLEERYAPLGNSPDIKFSAVRNALPIPSEPDLRLREIAKGIEKLLLSENKNVKQPPPAAPPDFSDRSRPTLLVIGQVVNDFSIIEQRTGWPSSIAFYRKLIGKVLEATDFNVVFKGHPWEEKKIHLEAPRTVEALSELQDRHPGRLAICNHHNLGSLGKGADQVALLNSQAGLELAFFCGLRPATFGQPFYGDAGFSDEYSSIDSFVSDAKNGRSGHLDLEGFEALQDFLMRYLQFQTVTDRPSGWAQVQSKLALRAEILAPKKRGTPPNSPVSKARSKASLNEARSALSTVTTTVEGVLSPSRGVGTSQLTSTQRKWRKLRRDPKAFLADSRLLRWLKK